MVSKSLEFPAVTICNQNAFRGTEAARTGRYRLVEHMFSGTSSLSVEELAVHNATDMSMDDLYVDLAHSKKDMIVSCSWKNNACGAEDFKTVMTDHGLCYTFNRDASDMTITSSGVDSGLRLTLNVEQYEYMAGPHDAAGIKILLHDPREMAFVHELGQAVPTGAHAFFGLKFMSIDNLPAPHGDCAKKELRHTTHYTMEECYLDCLTKYAKITCGCRDTYWPYLNDSPPVCTIGQHVSCVEDLYDEFDRSIREKCRCPIPCHFSIYDPSVSYSSISNHLVSKLLSSNESKQLKEKLLQSYETTAKMDHEKFSHFQDLVVTFGAKTKLIEDVIMKIERCLQLQENQTKQLFVQMEDIYLTKEKTYRYQEYAIEKNFLRGREAMEERTLANVANAYAEFALVNTRRIRRLANSPADDQVRKELYEFIMDALEVRQEIAQLAKDNISLLIKSFINGTQIFNYKFENMPRAYNPHIVPKPLMNESMYHNAYMKKYVPKLENDDMQLMFNVLEMFMNQTKLAYEERSINETELNYVFERFQYACRTYLYSKSVVYSNGIDRPLAVIKDRHDQFDSFWVTFKREIEALNQNIKSLTELITGINSAILPTFKSLQSKLYNYTENGSLGLMDLATLFTSNHTDGFTTNVSIFFQEVQTRGQSISDLLSLIKIPVDGIWTQIIDDEDSWDYYNYTNNHLFLRNLSEVIIEWNSKLEDIKTFDIRHHVEHSAEDFYSSFENVVSHLKRFKASVVVDSTFLKENILQIDIFYRQLSYEYINQQKAYDFFALISDVGGAMGIMWLLLVLGCLAAVIFQIVDRVNYFYSWPITVNVEINYNQSMKFPTITICNQNAFRGSEAARTGRYRLVEEMFVSKDPLTAEDLDRHNATNTSLNELYADLAHAKEDMIV
ncbi:ASIC2-like protein, partial [Mya arenaria]